MVNKLQLIGATSRTLCFNIRIHVNLPVTAIDLHLLLETNGYY